ncbi:MAG: prepilin-type N-terminal cleavage/methylation domain-containing protein [Planctomycetes bacterium]|nr:prepilin-type N-terminal cleavage/methylation domain-containing protein [Planctomycetota bacterium]
MKRRGGFTLVELLVAAGLLVVVSLLVFGFLRRFTSLWQKSEERRELVEEASGITELFAEDIGALVNGPRGDLVAEWVFFDTDGDDQPETMWPRVRFLRFATEAELVRREARTPDAKKHTGEGVLEVCWLVAPAYAGKAEPDRRAEGIVMRGERLQVDESLSFFEPGFFDSSNKPRQTPNEVSGGVLWFGLEFATQTSLVFDGWKLGDELADAATSWDAWNRGRPNADRHFWNEPGKGMPKTGERALLPRRVRLSLEIERAEDRKRRTRLSSPMAAADAVIEVEDGSRVPELRGSFVRIDAEWMEVSSVDGRSVNVRRGSRGSNPVGHEVGAMVHFGRALTREIPVRTHQEDWNL